VAVALRLPVTLEARLMPGMAALGAKPEAAEHTHELPLSARLRSFAEQWPCYRSEPKDILPSGCMHVGKFF
jgi:hypothetical protein